MDKYRKLRQAAQILVFTGAIFILLFILMEANWIKAFYLSIWQTLGLALVLIGAITNIYAYHRFTQYKISQK